MPALRSDHAASGLSLLLQELRPSLLRFLTARLGDAAEAEDVAQDLWLRVRDGAAGPVANGRAYLFRAAQNLALDRVRERHRRGARDREWTQSLQAPPSGPEVADPRPGAEASLLAQEEAEALAAAISALPEAAGRAFRLHKIEGLSHAEVADRLGISRSGVEKHMAVAMSHLRRALAD